MAELTIPLTVLNSPDEARSITKTRSSQQRLVSGIPALSQIVLIITAASAGLPDVSPILA